MVKILFRYLVLTYLALFGIALRTQASVCSEGLSLTKFSSKDIQITLIESGYFVARHNNRVIGSLSFDTTRIVGESLLNRVQVDNKFRRRGVHELLVNKFFDFTSASKVHVVFEHVNKHSFLSSILRYKFPYLAKMFNGETVSLDMTETFFYENVHMLSQRGTFDSISQDILRDAAFSTPTGRSIRKHGLTLVSTKVVGSKFFDTSSVRIELVFIKSSTKLQELSSPN